MDQGAIVKDGHLLWPRESDIRVIAPSRATCSPNIIDPLTDPRWEAFAGSHPSAVVFHQPAWIQALVQVFGYEPRFHVQQDARGQIVAAWPTMLIKSRLTGTRLVCMPFCHGAGPLLDSPETAGQLLAAVVADAEQLNARFLEVRGWPTEFGAPDCLRSTHFYSKHVIELSPGPAQLMSSFHKDVRYSIRRSQRDGVTVRTARRREDVRAFYRLYVKQRQRQGLLPQPESFIQHIWSNAFDNDHGYLVLAEYNDHLVAGVLSLSHGDTVNGTHGAMDKAFRRHRPNHLTLWRTIEIACERGFKRYDLGRTGGDAEGLARFKARWGATEERLPYFYYPGLESVNVRQHVPGNGNAILSSCIQYSPRTVATTAARLLYRHLG